MRMSDSNHDSTEQPPPLLRSRANRVLLISVCLFLLLAVPSYLAVRKLWASRQAISAALPPQEVMIVASFRADFQPEQPAPGWRYYWNQNGPVGDTNSYVQLVWTGERYSTTDQQLPAPPPARYLRLSNRSGHPGLGSSQVSAIGGDDECAVIVGFTVPEVGRYAITNSLISRHDGAMSGSIHLQVFVNDRNTTAEVYCRSREGIPFDRELGTLAAGDSIYVSIGAGETDRNDSFGLDFSICRF
jgi:hypothetical protein